MCEMKNNNTFFLANTQCEKKYKNILFAFLYSLLLQLTNIILFSDYCDRAQCDQ